MNPIIATVYLPNGVSKAVPTFPGQRLSFVGGKAEVKHEMHMPTVLAMPDARVEVASDWREWLPKWVEQMPGFGDKVKASVRYEGSEDHTDPIHENMDHVVFGTHPAGHQCGFCQKARERAVAKAMEALPV